MLHVSGVELVAAACRNGVIGAFPTANARSTAQLDQWLTEIAARLFAAPEVAAPCCPNLIMRSPRLADDLACLVAHRVELVITSVGSPAPAVAALHGVGCLVLADVATIKHARQALAAGVDGLVLLGAGAGGQTGWLNPFAFVRALRAAQVLGCDLAYMGTRFIATRESLADDTYRSMLVDATADDVLLTRAFTGLPTSMLIPAIRRAGLDPATLDETVSPASAAQLFGGAARDASSAEGPRRWRDIWSAGHSVSGVRSVQTVEALVAEVAREFAATAPNTAPNTAPKHCP